MRSSIATRGEREILRVATADYHISRMHTIGRTCLTLIHPCGLPHCRIWLPSSENARFVRRSVITPPSFALCHGYHTRRKIPASIDMSRYARRHYKIVYHMTRSPFQRECFLFGICYRIAGLPPHDPHQYLKEVLPSVDSFLYLVRLYGVHSGSSSTNLL